uniref:EOG090X09KD n=1 Tax=Lynceus sp. MCZ IZ 141354 TaxID=1930659 RepID=A0A9N6WUP9_9CRUS|nr:EOG090X09KD [Lynceus sp. MCZ IZ 141354]
MLTDAQFVQFGANPKEEVLTLERILLQTIRFDLQVEHPYSFLLKYAKSIKGDRSKLEKMVNSAWIFVNDSLCTTLCLQWEPEIIAIALMYLACKMIKFDVMDWNNRQPKHLRWWDQFVDDLNTDVLEEICHQVLDSYSVPSTHKGEGTPPTVPQSTPPKPPLSSLPMPPVLPGVA